MNYPCNVIQDLLPLYHDGICSEESKAAVEQHLPACPACRERYAALQAADEMVITPAEAGMEFQKAASFRLIRKKLLRRQILIMAASFILLAVCAFSAVGVLKNSVSVVKYENNLSVSLVDGSLVGRLIGSRESYMKIVRTAVTINGAEKHYLFYSLSASKWDELTTSKEVFSEYVLCPAEKSADAIDRVYYYTGDYTGLESISRDELQKVIDASVLLWSK